MVKTKAPIISLDATGSLADVLTMSKSKRTTYTKRHAAPAQPRTAKQLSARAIVGWCATQWASLTSTQRATWEARAAKTDVGPYHAFVAENCRRWHNERGPTKEDPAAETSTEPQRPGGFVDAGIKMATLRINYEFPYPTWGYAIARSTSTFPQNAPDLWVAFSTINPVPRTHYRDTPLETGTYYYRWAAFNVDGVRAGQGGIFSVVIA